MNVWDYFNLGHLLFIGGLIGISILYRTSQSFNYFAKFAKLLLAVMVATHAGGFLALVRGARERKSFLIVSACVRLFLPPLMGLDIRVRGEEHIKEDTPCIMVMNHQSSIDVIPLFVFWPDNCVSLAKKEIIWSTGTFGIAAWLCGTVYIDRSNPQKARKTMEDTAALIKAKRLRVAIFPEGTRNHNGGLLPFKKGAFHLAVQAQVPVVPVVFSSYESFYSKKERRFDEGKILVEILPPIKTEGLTSADVTELSERTREMMLETLTQISEEVKTLV